MNRYRIRFMGRTKGAIGIFHEIREDVEAIDVPGAVFALYERYDHIHNPQVIQIAEDGSLVPGVFGRDGERLGVVNLADWK